LFSNSTYLGGASISRKNSALSNAIIPKKSSAVDDNLKPLPNLEGVSSHLEVQKAMGNILYVESDIDKYSEVEAKEEEDSFSYSDFDEFEEEDEEEEEEEEKLA